MPFFYLFLIFVDVIHNFVFTLSYGIYETKNKKFAPLCGILGINAAIVILFLMIYVH